MPLLQNRLNLKKVHKGKIYWSDRLWYIFNIELSMYSYDKEWMEARLAIYYFFMKVGYKYYLLKDFLKNTVEYSLWPEFCLHDTLIEAECCKQIF